MAKSFIEQKKDVFSFSRFDIIFENESSEVNKILQETVLTLNQNKITFELGIENGKIEPLTTLSKLIKSRNIDLKIKAYDSSKNNVGEFILEKCRFLNIENPLKFLNFSKVMDPKSMDRITIDYTFERMTFNNLVMYEMPNPLEQLKSEVKKSHIYIGDESVKKISYEEAGEFAPRGAVYDAEEAEAPQEMQVHTPFFGGFTGRPIYAEETADRAAYLSHGGEMIEAEMLKG